MFKEFKMKIEQKIDELVKQIRELDNKKRNFYKRIRSIKS
jgi:hypothetical protein